MVRTQTGSVNMEKRKRLIGWPGLPALARDDAYAQSGSHQTTHRRRFISLKGDIGYKARFLTDGIQQIAQTMTRFQTNKRLVSSFGQSNTSAFSQGMSTRHEQKNLFGQQMAPR